MATRKTAQTNKTTKATKRTKTLRKPSKPASTKEIKKPTRAKRPTSRRSPVPPRSRAITRAVEVALAVAGSDFSRNAIGIDVSHYEPQVDWAQVKVSGVSFAYIKATEGTTITDLAFANHWRGVRNAKILRGAYHFFQPTQDAIAQAQQFAAVVGVGNSDLPPALDLEVNGDNTAKDRRASAIAANIEGVHAWLVRIEEVLGMRPVIYTNKDTWDRVVQKLGGTPPAWQARYPLWAANWRYSYSDGDRPIMPPGWAEWTFWQFDSTDKTDINGNPTTPLVSIAGLPDGGDFNLYHGTLDELRAWIGASAPTGPSAGDQKTHFQGSNQDVINVFWNAFGNQDYWDNKIVPAGLAYLAEDRPAAYTGPAVEDLPNLSELDRQILRSVLVPNTTWPQFGFVADKRTVQAGESVRFSWRISDGVEGVYFWNGTAFEGVGGTDSRTVRPPAPPATADYYLKVLANHGHEYQSPRIHIDVSAAEVVPPALPTKPLIGLHMMVNDPLSAGNRGCRFVTCMSTDGMDPSRANQFKRAFPQAVVMYRRYLKPSQKPSPQQMFDLLQVDIDSELVYIGQNEGDQFPYGTPDQIRQCAAFDIELARLVKARAPNAGYAAGSFARLNPDFRKPEVCQAMREGYANAYNSGLIGFDMHLYSPDYDHIFSNADLVDERNWINLFTRCGFDPNRRAIYASETGIDHLSSDQGPTGFVGLGLSANDVVLWMQRWVEVQSQPINVNGVSYASPFVGGAIFQCGGNGDQQWNQYNVAGFLEAMRSVWDA